MVVPFHRDRTPQGYSHEIWWVGKSLSRFQPLWGSVILRSHTRSPCESNFPRAPTHSGGPIEVRLIFVIIFPQAVFPIKMEGLSRAMIFLYGRIMVLGELLMG